MPWSRISPRKNTLKFQHNLCKEDMYVILHRHMVSVKPIRRIFMQDQDGSHSCQLKTQELPQNELDDPGSRRERPVTGAVNHSLFFRE